MRLNQFLGRSGVSSRRGGDELIRRGAVTVNGEIVLDLGRRVDPSRDAIKVDGRRVFVETFHYYLYYKPDGMMSTVEDPEGRPALGDVVRKLGAGRLFPVGRLDFHTEGLVFLTNDGELAQKMLHPKFQVPRIYLAKVQGILSRDEFDRMAQGIRLEDGWARAEVEPERRMERNSYVRVTVREGRNRLVRRLFEAMGHPVVKLKRVGFGPLRLGKLLPGESRKLSEEEVRALQKPSGGASKPPGPAKPGFKNRKRVTGTTRRAGRR